MVAEENVEGCLGIVVELIIKCRELVKRLEAQALVYAAPAVLEQPALSANYTYFIVYVLTLVLSLCRLKGEKPTTTQLYQRHHESNPRS